MNQHVSQSAFRTREVTLWTPWGRQSVTEIDPGATRRLWKSDHSLWREARRRKQRRLLLKAAT
ncbi:hypothetical protein [Mesorhizobium sp. CAU 1732]|uniref:hypothetical protein n=1 Tax=Mesorhizobium sp. CAU 1732 TaxID=3140358 RepID=UPI0032609CEF